MAVKFTPLSRIEVPGGDVLKIISVEDETFSTFGETYVTTIEPDVVKPWRRNLSATANLVVVSGEVRFVTTVDGETFSQLTLSPDGHFGRITIPPGYWLAFQGLSRETATIVNVLSCVHRATDIERKSLDDFGFTW